MGNSDSDPIVTKWISGGDEVVVSTTRNPGESDADWFTRHFAAVEAKRQDYPPD